MSLFQDLRFASRMMLKDKWFSAVAITALALGIGVNATVFTLVNAVLIRGLPFKDSGSLYVLSWKRSDGGGANLSYSDLQDWRGRAKSFTGLGAFSNTGFNISDDYGPPEQARGGSLTANAFGILGQQPMLGRDFGPDDDRQGAEPVVILGNSLWKNRYGSDPSVLGRVVRLNGKPFTVIGVMPPDMKFPTNAELWTSFIPTEQQMKRSARFLIVFGRLAPGVGRASAVTEMNGIAVALSKEYPDTNKLNTGVEIETFNDRFNGGPIRVVFLSLMGSVGFVLLIACANVANLLLSRSAQRAREIAVRIALGATRWRITRQLLIESILLGFVSGVGGLLLAIVGVRLFDIAVDGVGKPYWIKFTMDYMVFGYLAAVCVGTGILFGIVPALQVSRTNVNDIIKEGGRGSAGNRRARWMSGTMVVVELALTIVLLVGAGLMIRSFLKLYSLDLGIRTENLMTMRVSLSDQKYRTPEARRAFFERLAPRLASIPGVDAAAVTTSVPPNGGTSRDLEIDGRPPLKDGDKAPEVTAVTISPSFFDTVGVPLRRGRAFTDQDGAAGYESVIVNERLAAQLFANEDPIGKRIRFRAPENPPPNTPAPVWRTIVGISATVKHNSPQEAAPPSVVYVPYRQEPPGGAALLVRSRLDPSAVMGAVRREVQAIDQDQPVSSVQTMDQLLAQSQWPFRVFGTLFAILAFIGLTLSAIGLYAVMAYSVTQRTQEIGVRMALGAAARQVSWLVLRRGLVQLAIGLAIGVGGAYWLTSAMKSQISQIVVQITPNDPGTFAAITLLLLAVGVAACIIPARRATRVDPMVAFRAE